MGFPLLPISPFLSPPLPKSLAYTHTHTHNLSLSLSLTHSFLHFSPSVYISLHIYIYYISLSLFLPLSPSISVYFSPYIYLFIHPSIHPSIYLSISPFLSSIVTLSFPPPSKQTRQAIFGPASYSRAQTCTKHKDDSFIDLRRRACQFPEGCTRPALSSVAHQQFDTSMCAFHQHLPRSSLDSTGPRSGCEVRPDSLCPTTTPPPPPGVNSVWGSCKARFCPNFRRNPA